MMKKSKPVDRKTALKAAIKHVTRKISQPSQYKVYSRKPKNLDLYMHAEPCWFVYAPWSDGLSGGMLRSSRMILISKINGRVLYDGPANGE